MKQIKKNRHPIRDSLALEFTLKVSSEFDDMSSIIEYLHLKFRENLIPRETFSSKRLFKNATKASSFNFRHSLQQRFFTSPLIPLENMYRKLKNSKTKSPLTFFVSKFILFESEWDIEFRKYSSLLVTSYDSVRIGNFFTYVWNYSTENFAFIISEVIIRTCILLHIWQELQTGPHLSFWIIFFNCKRLIILELKRKPTFELWYNF